jgi:ubiquinone/menaquinone biosynthesis C-methylase UbiE
MTNEELASQTLEQYNDPVFAAEYAESIDGRLDAWQTDEFLELVQPGGHILDAGCAAGRDVAYIANKGYKVVGVDLAAALINEAKKRHPELNFSIGDFTQLPFENNIFDGIWNRAALVHMPSQEFVQRALREFARILKPGGVISIRTKAQKPDEAETVVRKDKLSNRERFFRFQNKEQIEKDLSDAGFNIVSSQIYNELELADRVDNPAALRDESWLLIVARKNV